MSSLLDQFNSQSMQSQSDPYPVMADSVKNSGYISMQGKTSSSSSIKIDTPLFPCNSLLPDDARKIPIFKKHKMNISFPHNIVQMEMCNSNLVLIMSNNVVFRMNLNDVDRFDGEMIQNILHPLISTLSLSLQRFPWTSTLAACG